MDFSNNIYRPPPSLPLSHDTMDHAKMVMACRFGWHALPDQDHPGDVPSGSLPAPPPLSTSTRDFKTKRFLPCRGRLYHQLTCSHRIRTDLVEDCGSNCLDPIANTSALPFYCHECVESEVSNIVAQREAQHNATFPPLEQMSKEMYDEWYDQHCGLVAQLSKDRKAYEIELQSKTRPSNICSAIEASEEDLAFAAELDSLSLAMEGSFDERTGQIPTRPQRISLPNDASEQLHWQLNSLALDRGSCSVEYSTKQPIPHQTLRRTIDDRETLWRKSRP